MLIEMEYETVAEYLDAFTDDGHELAILPVTLAATYLGRTPAAISAMMRPRPNRKKPKELIPPRLQTIRIGKNRFVALHSLLTLHNEWLGDVRSVHDFLVRELSRGQEIVFYQDAMDVLDISPNIPADRAYIGRVLGEISRRTLKENGTLLSVIVHRKTRGRTGPGPGFFKLADDLGLKRKDDRKFVEQHIEKVHDHYLDFGPQDLE